MQRRYSNAAIEYLKLKYLNDWWAGRMGADALFSQGAMQIVEGSFGDLAFMVPVEEPLKEAYQEIERRVSRSTSVGCETRKIILLSFFIISHNSILPHDSFS